MPKITIDPAGSFADDCQVLTGSPCKGTEGLRTLPRQELSSEAGTNIVLAVARLREELIKISPTLLQNIRISVKDGNTVIDY